MNTQHIVVFVTAKDQQQARTISQKLLEAKLVACVNIIPAVESWFWWEGKVDQSQEAMMVIKSRRDLFPQIFKVVKAAHSYQVPEIIALPLVEGSAEYLRWIDESVQS
ncbi:MAG: divalent-cation tolerance protein CutA [Candidatus Omnitrophica bacterium]|nr:divalent-cation tolerance protein CutA [Candidatus Omnitrophota bacterium]